MSTSVKNKIDFYHDPEIGTKLIEVSKLRYILYHGLEFASKCLLCWTRVCHKSGEDKMMYLEFGQRYAFGKDLPAPFFAKSRMLMKRLMLMNL